MPPDPQAYLYRHIDEATVRTGQRVTTAMQVGFEGNTASSSQARYILGHCSGRRRHASSLSTLELLKRGELWVPRYVNAMGNTSDPLYYLTGDVSGEMKRLL